MAGRATPATDTTVQRGDWYGADISALSYERTLFQDADFDEATGTGARFVDCVFRGGSFVAAELDACAFENCTFVRCVFRSARFTECKFVGSTFDGGELDQLYVSGGSWSFTGLAGADLRHASFTDVAMREADLAGARLVGAVVTGCDLSGATWSRADLTRCDLRRSDLSTIDPFGVQLSGAIVDWEQAVVLARNFGLDVRSD